MNVNYFVRPYCLMDQLSMITTIIDAHSILSRADLPGLRKIIKREQARQISDLGFNVSPRLVQPSA